jgi:predicted transcriptional regulator
MKQQNVIYFTDKEEEFVNLLIEIGTRKNVAKILVFLANTPKASARVIERGVDMRQPEVSVAMTFLTDLGWIKNRENSSESKGRPMKIYELAKPMNEIIEIIENDKKTEAKKQLALVQKLRAYIT